MGLLHFSLLALGVFSGVQQGLAKTAEEWRDRVVYQILTDRFAVNDTSNPECQKGSGKYCGGTWKGIQSKLDYIQEMGFNAVWMSPIDKNVEGTYGEDGESYHGYWNSDFTRLNDHWGSEDDLIDLINDMHNRDMWVMFDALANSMAIPGPPENITYSNLHPFNSSDYFHPFCWIDYASTNNSEIEDCWAGDDEIILADLNLESKQVSSYLNEHIHDVVQRYGIDGIRVDAIKQMNPNFFPDYLKSAGVFSVGEMFSYNPDISCSVRHQIDSITSYPIRQGIEFAFNNTGAAFQYLQQIDTQFQQACSGQDMSTVANFLENHDLPRYPYITDDASQNKGAIVFLLLHTGIPIIYYGQEQHLTGGAGTSDNREALWNYGYNISSPNYQLIRTVVALRKQAMHDNDKWTTTNHQFLNNELRYSFVQKGDVLGVYTNFESNSDKVAYDVSSNFDEGTVVREVLSNTTATVGSSGTLPVTITTGMPQVYYPEASLTSFEKFLGTPTSIYSSSVSYPTSSLSDSLSSSSSFASPTTFSSVSTHHRTYTSGSSTFTADSTSTAYSTSKPTGSHESKGSSTKPLSLMMAATCFLAVALLV
ncbi:cell wall alpha-amylase-like protein Aah1 [Schizosaccharomyces osmophilus]|uniref:alpha-amylase n=1 Tax=Schizosaccharomyces osmophilus TaxID=2545709 RepID=A0AAE9WG76_9SCHI|nr:cell wall alpha-amylase-like protein Aah1 [Schizosaccharomyces osmophilus]WBW74496.1 cell wall alpha-amylase-like protein Aah1 [Schizosaccharomyces osmophilus]